MITEQTAYRCKPDAETMELDGEWAVLNPETCTITKLNELGGLIWTRLRRDEPMTAIVRAIQDEYEVPVEVAAADIARFVESLVAVGLLETSGARG
ncbi:MAG TPA: PqqD family protein [Paenibacillus sp.]|uniref:PqqD family protein n=1 Tax=Paenibacillus sp. TaxID=58172 RepID=UPI002BC0360B|nr:PqqD family protein [Paenibacillus sp.]HUC92439.1 PqqD family protein [Paenibacillus sp.]